jgi:serine phosphatase RsbU (regulator of sigma subunit)
LEATGLPLGLFSHATHGASTCGLVAGAVLLIVSRGIIEADYRGEEFGLEGAQQALQGAVTGSARGVCLTILQAAQEFMRLPLTHNDVTTIALLREG